MLKQDLRFIAQLLSCITLVMVMTLPVLTQHFDATVDQQSDMLLGETPATGLIELVELGLADFVAEFNRAPAEFHLAKPNALAQLIPSQFLPPRATDPPYAY